MNEITASIPPSFYVVIGTLVVTNIATIISALVFIFNAGVWKAKMEAADEAAKDSAIRAHKRINRLEGIRAEEDGE